MTKAATITASNYKDNNNNWKQQQLSESVYDVCVCLCAESSLQRNPNIVMILQQHLQLN